MQSDATPRKLLKSMQSADSSNQNENAELDSKSLIKGFVSSLDNERFLELLRKPEIRKIDPDSTTPVVVFESATGSASKSKSPTKHAVLDSPALKLFLPSVVDGILRIDPVSTAFTVHQPGSPPTHLKQQQQQPFPHDALQNDAIQFHSLRIKDQVLKLKERPPSNVQQPVAEDSILLHKDTSLFHHSPRLHHQTLRILPHAGLDRSSSMDEEMSGLPSFAPLSKRSSPLSSHSPQVIEGTLCISMHSDLTTNRQPFLGLRQPNLINSPAQRESGSPILRVTSSGDSPRYDGGSTSEVEEDHSTSNIKDDFSPSPIRVRQYSPGKLATSRLSRLKQYSFDTYMSPNKSSNRKQLRQTRSAEGEEEDEDIQEDDNDDQDTDEEEEDIDTGKLPVKPFMRSPRTEAAVAIELEAIIRMEQRKSLQQSANKKRPSFTSTVDSALSIARAANASLPCRVQKLILPAKMTAVDYVLIFGNLLAFIGILGTMAILVHLLAAANANDLDIFLASFLPRS